MLNVPFSQANASRPADLAPSQGGRYTGFGSTPPVTTPSSHPFGLSSAAAPTLSDLQADPVATLGKGWSLLSSAVVGATRAVNNTVIQPTVERVSDPTFRAGVTQYVSESAKNANTWGKSQLGVDVGSMIGNLKTGGADSARGRYTSLGGEGQQYHGSDDEDGSSALYADAGNDEFFHDFENKKTGLVGSSINQAAASSKVQTPPTKKKNDDDWDDNEWKDF